MLEQNEAEIFGLIKDQTRAIATYRNMMDRGYFIVFLADKNRLGFVKEGRWALCKYPTPSDKDRGIAIFNCFEEAFEKAKYLVWIDANINKHCDKVYDIAELNSLIRD